MKRLDAYNFKVDLGEDRQITVQASHNHATVHVAQLDKSDTRALLHWMHESGWIFVTHHNDNFIFRHAVS